MSTMQELQVRYERALHALQTGVACELEQGCTSGSPKHLRVGVNSALVETSTLLEVLLEAKIITLEDYTERLCKNLEAEVARYEERISASLKGAKVKLG